MLRYCDGNVHAVLPAGINASPTNVKASPIFIDISPTVKVIPNSNKAPTYSAGIAIKPNPDPGTVQNEFGKVHIFCNPLPLTSSHCWIVPASGTLGCWHPRPVLMSWMVKQGAYNEQSDS